MVDFTNQGGGLWNRDVSGTLYQFSQGSGQLSVIPEPSTLGLLALAVSAMALVRRRRMN